ncbi:MAG: Smr/MutS family protein [Rhodospirillaceae bacterium]|nr:Smr/MutS family protein [Rhodospirillaceae bacterium]
MTDKRRKPDPDDLVLWQAATREAKPIKRRPGLRKGATEAAKPTVTAKAAAASAPAKPAKPLVLKRAVARPVALAPKKTEPPPLERGQSPGVDKRQAERLKRGRTPIDARLDLHGMTQDAAHRRLAIFIENAVAADKRAIVVVTGKGLKEGSGVLRAAVPRWLNEPRLRPHILTYEYAQPKDGGMGALYILLRKRR